MCHCLVLSHPTWNLHSEKLAKNTTKYYLLNLNFIEINKAWARISGPDPCVCVGLYLTGLNQEFEHIH